MMVNGKMALIMVTVFVIIPMVTNTMVHGKKVCKMKKGFFTMLMVANKKLFTKMGIKSAVNSYDWKFLTIIFNICNRRSR